MSTSTTNGFRLDNNDEDDLHFDELKGLDYGSDFGSVFQQGSNVNQSLVVQDQSMTEEAGGPFQEYEASAGNDGLLEGFTSLAAEAARSLGDGTSQGVEEDSDFDEDLFDSTKVRQREEEQAGDGRMEEEEAKPKNNSILVSEETIQARAKKSSKSVSQAPEDSQMAIELSSGKKSSNLDIKSSASIQKPNPEALKSLRKFKHKTKRKTSFGMLSISKKASFANADQPFSKLMKNLEKDGEMLKEKEMDELSSLKHLTSYLNHTVKPGTMFCDRTEDTKMYLKDALYSGLIEELQCLTRPRSGIRLADPAKLSSFSAGLLKEKNSAEYKLRQRLNTKFQSSYIHRKQAAALRASRLIKKTKKTNAANKKKDSVEKQYIDHMLELDDSVEIEHNLYEHLPLVEDPKGTVYWYRSNREKFRIGEIDIKRMSMLRDQMKPGNLRVNDGPIEHFVTIKESLKKEDRKMCQIVVKFENKALGIVEEVLRYVGDKFDEKNTLVMAYLAYLISKKFDFKLFKNLLNNLNKPFLQQLQDIDKKIVEIEDGIELPKIPVRGLMNALSGLGEPNPTGRVSKKMEPTIEVTQEMMDLLMNNKAEQLRRMKKYMKTVNKSSVWMVLLATFEIYFDLDISLKGLVCYYYEMYGTPKKGTSKEPILLYKAYYHSNLKKCEKAIKKKLDESIDMIVDENEKREKQLAERKARRGDSELSHNDALRKVIQIKREPVERVRRDFDRPIILDSEDTLVEEKVDTKPKPKLMAVNGGVLSLPEPKKSADKNIEVGKLNKDMRKQKELTSSTATSRTGGDGVVEADGLDQDDLNKMIEEDQIEEQDKEDEVDDEDEDEMSSSSDLNLSSDSDTSEKSLKNSKIKPKKITKKQQKRLRKIKEKSIGEKRIKTFHKVTKYLDQPAKNFPLTSQSALLVQIKDCLSLSKPKITGVTKPPKKDIKNMFYSELRLRDLFSNSMQLKSDPVFIRCIQAIKKVYLKNLIKEDGHKFDLMTYWTPAENPSQKPTFDFYFSLDIKKDVLEKIGVKCDSSDDIIWREGSKDDKDKDVLLYFLSLMIFKSLFHNNWTLEHLINYLIERMEALQKRVPGLAKRGNRSQNQNKKAKMVEGGAASVKGSNLKNENYFEKEGAIQPKLLVLESKQSQKTTPRRKFEKKGGGFVSSKKAQDKLTKNQMTKLQLNREPPSPNFDVSTPIVVENGYKIKKKVKNQPTKSSVTQADKILEKRKQPPAKIPSPPKHPRNHDQRPRYAENEREPWRRNKAYSGSQNRFNQRIATEFDNPNHNYHHNRGLMPSRNHQRVERPQTRGGGYRREDRSREFDPERKRPRERSRKRFGSSPNNNPASSSEESGFFEDAYKRHGRENARSKRRRNDAKRRWEDRESVDRSRRRKNRNQPYRERRRSRSPHNEPGNRSRSPNRRRNGSRSPHRHQERFSRPKVDRNNRSQQQRGEPEIADRASQRRSFKPNDPRIQEMEICRKKNSVKRDEGEQFDPKIKPKDKFFKKATLSSIANASQRKAPHRAHTEKRPDRKRPGLTSSGRLSENQTVFSGRASQKPIGRRRKKPETRIDIEEEERQNQTVQRNRPADLDQESTGGNPFENNLKFLFNEMKQSQLRSEKARINENFSKGVGLKKGEQAAPEPSKKVKMSTQNESRSRKMSHQKIPKVPKSNKDQRVERSTMKNSAQNQAKKTLKSFKSKAQGENKTQNRRKTQKKVSSVPSQKKSKKFDSKEPEIEQKKSQENKKVNKKHPPTATDVVIDLLSSSDEKDSGENEDSPQSSETIKSSFSTVNSSLGEFEESSESEKSLDNLASGEKNDENLDSPKEQTELVKKRFEKSTEKNSVMSKAPHKAKKKQKGVRKASGSTRRKNSEKEAIMTQTAGESFKKAQKELAESQNKLKESKTGKAGRRRKNSSIMIESDDQELKAVTSTSGHRKLKKISVKAKKATNIQLGFVTPTKKPKKRNMAKKSSSSSSRLQKKSIQNKFVNQPKNKSKQNEGSNLSKRGQPEGLEEDIEESLEESLASVGSSAKKLIVSSAYKRNRDISDFECLSVSVAKKKGKKKNTKEQDSVDQNDQIEIFKELNETCSNEQSPSSDDNPKIITKKKKNFKLKNLAKKSINKPKNRHSDHNSKPFEMECIDLVDSDEEKDSGSSGTGLSAEKQNSSEGLTNSPDSKEIDLEEDENEEEERFEDTLALSDSGSKIDSNGEMEDEGTLSEPGSSNLSRQSGSLDLDSSKNLDFSKTGKSFSILSVDKNSSLEGSEKDKKGSKLPNNPKNISRKDEVTIVSEQPLSMILFPLDSFNQKTTKSSKSRCSRKGSKLKKSKRDEDSGKIIEEHEEEEIDLQSSDKDQFSCMQELALVNRRVTAKSTPMVAKESPNVKYPPKNIRMRKASKEAINKQKEMIQDHDYPLMGSRNHHVGLHGFDGGGDFRIEEEENEGTWAAGVQSMDASMVFDAIRKARAKGM